MKKTFMKIIIITIALCFTIPPVLSYAVGDSDNAHTIDHLECAMQIPSHDTEYFFYQQGDNPEYPFKESSGLSLRPSVPDIDYPDDFWCITECWDWCDAAFEDDPIKRIECKHGCNELGLPFPPHCEEPPLPEWECCFECGEGGGDYPFECPEDVVEECSGGSAYICFLKKTDGGGVMFGYKCDF